MEIIQTKDGFMWGNVSDKALAIWDAGIFPLYVLFDDESEVLIETRKELEHSLSLGATVVIEIGQAYTKLKSKSDWDSVEKMSINGFLYVKANDVIFN